MIEYPTGDGTITTMILTNNGLSAKVIGMKLSDSKKQEILKALRAEDGPKHIPAQVEATLELLGGAGFENLHPALKPWVADTILGPMVKHPFVYCNLGGEAGLYVGQANQIYERKRECRQKYLKNKDWEGYMWALERPWRMSTLETLYDRGRITLEKLREMLIEIWTDTECPQGNQETPVKLFHATGFITDDQEGWDSLPDEITVYRGVDGELELTADGPSWTLEKRVAEVFAYRLGAHGDLYRYTMKKSEALAYITDRGEAEIILDFNRDSNPDEIYLEG